MHDQDDPRFVLLAQNLEDRLNEADPCDRPSVHELEGDRRVHLLLTAWKMILEEQQAAGDNPESSTVIPWAPLLE